MRVSGIGMKIEIYFQVISSAPCIFFQDYTDDTVNVDGIMLHLRVLLGGC